MSWGTMSLCARETKKNVFEGHTFAASLKKKVTLIFQYHTFLVFSVTLTLYWCHKSKFRFYI